MSWEIVPPKTIPERQAALSIEDADDEQLRMIYDLILRASRYYFYTLKYGSTVNFSSPEDITQHLIVKILRKRYRFRGEAKLETVIDRMVTNLYISEWRKRDVRMSYAEKWRRLSENEQSLNSLHRDTLRRIATEALSGYELEIVTLLAEGLSQEKIGQILGKSRFRVGRDLRKILAKLVNQLEE